MVFKIHQGYRTIGVNYGLGVYYVDFGIGANYATPDVAKKLLGLGLERKGWVALRGDPVGVKGCGVLVQGLKQLGMRIEIESEGNRKSPGWFSQVDRWLIWWSPKPEFNYGALRPRQDLLVYKGDDVAGFLEETDKWDISRGILSNNREDIRGLIKSREIRVFKESEYEGYSG